MFKTVLQKSQDGYWAVWLLNQSRRQLTRQGRQRRHLRPSCTGHSQWKCPVERRWSEEVRRIQALCEEFKHLFGPPPNGGCKLPPIDIELKQDSNGRYMEPRRMQARYVSPWINELIREDTAMRIEKGWMRWPKPDEICEYASPVVAAKQPQKGPDARRICADYRHINDCAKETRHPVKNQKEVMARLRLKTRFATFDLRKGYHQCKLTDRAAKLLAVATQDGLVIPITAPFGFHGLPAQFQYYISKLVLKELDGNGIESFIDDLNVNANEFEELIRLIRELFTRLDEWDLRINGSKTVINVPSCTYLGHEVDGEGRGIPESECLVSKTCRDRMIANRLKHSWEESITCENIWGLISPNSLCQLIICSRKTQVSIGQRNANSVSTRSRKEQHKM